MTPEGSPEVVVVRGAVWILDLDGVVWLTGRPIGDAAGSVERLRGAGVRVVFVTNNSAPTTDELLERFRRIGIPADASDLAGSADAAASLLEPGDTVAVLGEAGLVEALGRRGVAVADHGPYAAAVVGWSRDFDFDRLASTATAARQSGRLIGTNQDPTHPTPDGLMPGSGSILAAVSTASGVTPEVAGKPNPPMVALLRQRFGIGEGGPPVVVVGDQPGTDGRLAEALGVPFALVDSGVTPAGAPVAGVPVAVRRADLDALVAGAMVGHPAHSGSD
jgi:HAD superfamily hydrolase (TIGR01450 family)